MKTKLHSSSRDEWRRKLAKSHDASVELAVEGAERAVGAADDLRQEAWFAMEQSQWAASKAAAAAEAKKAAERDAARARKQALREARAWRRQGFVNERDVTRTARAEAVRATRDMEDRVGKTLVRHEQTLRELNTRLEQQNKRGGKGPLLLLAALAGGAYYLVKNQQAREKVMDTVGKYSPQARDWLEQTGQRASQLKGSAWIERDETTVTSTPVVVTTTTPTVVQQSPPPTGAIREAAQDVQRGPDHAPEDVRIATREAELNATQVRPLRQDTKR